MVKPGRKLAFGVLGGMVFSFAHAGTENTANVSPSPASDAASTQSGLVEVVVTAQRRTERLQDVPIAVSALSGEQLEQAGAARVVDLSGIVPNLASRVQANGIQLYIRGVGANTGASPGDEPSVSTYIDGMYMPTGSSVAASSFPNIERVEVLKGPQGTLFGRNATAGVLQIVTRDPSQDELTGEASLGYGRYDTVTAKGYISGPLTSWLAADLALFKEEQDDGLGRNVYNGRETFAYDDLGLRSKWLITPAEGTEIRVIGDYHRYESDSPQYQLAQSGRSGLNPIYVYPGAFNTQGNFDPLNDLEEFSASIKLDQDIGDLHFANQATYRDFENQVRQDLDSTPIAALDADLYGEARTITNEAQLFGPTDSRLEWMVGAFYFDLEGGYEPFHQVGSVTGANAFLDTYTWQDIKSFSPYAQGTYALTDATKLTLGLRHTSETREFSARVEGPSGVITGPITDELKSKDWTWRVALAHEFTPDVSGYVSYNRGIKSGGYSMTSPTAPAYEPEQLDAYEVGMKTELLSGALRLNLAAFYYDYQDVQVRQNAAGFNIVTNAASGESLGLDFDYAWQVTDSFKLTGGMGWLPTAEFTDYENAPHVGPSGGATTFASATDNRLTNSPELTASTAGQYEWLLANEQSLLANIGITYEGYSYANPDNRVKYPERTLVNASVTWNRGDFSAEVWLRNAFDEEYYTYRSNNGFGDLQVRGLPRTYGVRLTQKF